MKILLKVARWAKATATRKAEAWGATSARWWAAYWLLGIGSMLVCASVVLRWINFPLSHNVSALQLPIIRSLTLNPHYHLLSFGFLVITLLGVGIFSQSFSRSPLLLAAGVLLALFVTLPCQLAFEQPDLLRRLSDESNDVAFIRDFAKQYLPQNFGYVEDIPSHLELGTVLGRFLAAVSFLGLGWVCFGFGSLMVALHAIGRLGGNKRLIASACLFLPLGALLILFTRPLIGEYFFMLARTEQALGRNLEAIADYRRAMWWDRWYAEDIRTYALIGDLQQQSSFAEGSPERHIYQAQLYREARQFEPAIFEYGQAASAGGSIASAARLELARTRLQFGLALYRAGGVGAAVTAWQRSFAENPAQIQALIYLARGQYDLAHYRASLDAANQLTKAAGLTSVLADAYAIGGDCYTKLGETANARRYYLRSLTLDNDINFWATAALVGK